MFLYLKNDRNWRGVFFVCSSSTKKQLQTRDIVYNMTGTLYIWSINMLIKGFNQFIGNGLAGTPTRAPTGALQI